MSQNSVACRCGHSGDGDHPCHGNGYTCRAPAARRFLAYPVCLAGAQPKFGAYETWACDACLTAYRARVATAVSP